MAGYQILTPSAGSTDWTSADTQREKQRKGFMALSFTNWDDSTSAPAINSGSVVEVGGSLFQFTSTEAISGSYSTSNLNYIYLTSSSSSITASATSTAPTWSAAKQGWYDSGGTKRCIGGCGINKNMKWLYTKGEDNLMSKTIAIGDWDMYIGADGSAQKYVVHGLGGAWKNIRSIDLAIRNDADATYYINGKPWSDGTAVDLAIYQYNSTEILLFNRDGGSFDNVSFDSTNYNRGWLTIDFEV